MKKLLVLIFSILISFNSYGSWFGITSIEDATCSEVAKNAKGTELKNIFGGEFKVISVTNSIEISRTKDKLVCLGDLRLDNGVENTKLRMELKKEDDQLWFNYQQEINSTSNVSNDETNNLLSRSTLKENILHCKKITNNNDRLICFDNMSKDIKTADAVLIPSIEKLFAENVLQIGGPGKPFYGCLIDIIYTKEQTDLLTGEISKGQISEVKIGNANNSLQTYVPELVGFFKGDANAPKIGDCFPFLLEYPISNQYGWGWANGWATIYKGDNFVVNEEVVNTTLKDTLTVEEYINDNVNYDSKIVELTGIVKNIDTKSFNTAKHFELYSPNLGSDLVESTIVVAFFDSKIWKDNDLIKDKIKSVEIGDTLVVKGYFDNAYTAVTHGFTINEILN